MKGKAAITNTAPPSLFEAFGSREFATGYLEILGAVFGVEDPLHRPAEYYIQYPDEIVGVLDDVWGLEFRLTGASRGQREPKIFHEALKALDELVSKTAAAAIPVGAKVQVFVVIMLDGDVPASKESGNYTSVIEKPAHWVEGLAAA